MATETALLIGQRYPEIQEIVVKLGRDWLDDIELWIDNAHGSYDITQIISRPTARDLVNSWQHQLNVRDGKRGSLTKLLVLEKIFSERLPDFSSSILEEMNLPKTIQVLREHVGFRLMDVSKEVGWQRPVTCARGYKLAREYFRAVIEGVGKRNEASNFHVNWNLAASTIKLSRYERVSRSDLLEALEAIRTAQQFQDSKQNLVSLELEALVRIFDIDGDSTNLYRGIKSVEQRDLYLTQDSLLGLAESWLRLCHAATSINTFEYCLEQAKKHLSNVSNFESIGHVGRTRYQLIKASVNLTQFPTNWSIRGVQFPFGITLKDHRHTGIPAETAQSLAKALETSPLGEPLERKIVAGLLSLAARQERTKRKRTELLEAAIEFRVGNRELHVAPWPRAALQDDQSRLEAARDILSLAQETKSPGRRFSGLRLLIEIIESNKNHSLPLIILCDDIERNGTLRIQNNGHAKKMASYLRKAIENKELRPLYIMAADRAYNNTELEKRLLGGRGDVVALEDQLGIMDKTFVFKRTSKTNFTREDAQCKALSEKLISLKKVDQLHLPESVAQLPVPDEVKNAHPQQEIVSVKRFADAETMEDFLKRCPDQVHKFLRKTVRLLAIFHTTATSFSAGLNTRRSLKSKEFGFWLKAFKDIDRDSIFTPWWETINKSVSFPKRDAHLLNWMVDAQDRIIALDMEAAGERPLGYELAQITEDSMLLEPSDFSTRHIIFNEYIQELKNQGLSIDQAIAWDSYICGIIARCTFLLSQPNAVSGAATYAILTLEYCAKQSKTSSAVSGAIVDAWKRSRGFKSSDSPETISKVARHRLSKQLAYTLRHDPVPKFITGGWLPLDEVVERLKAVGVETTPPKLLSVALAVDEDRFEVEELSESNNSSSQLIRAKYGHSRDIRMEIPDTDYQRPEELFHATASESLDKIIGESLGLLPMARQWVHMSTDPLKAFRTGRRHGSALLLKIDPGKLDGLIKASDKVWLSKTVPVEAISLVTVAETLHYFTE